VSIGKDRAVLRQLRTLFNVGTVRELTDGQLLERFATGRGEAAELAFAVLVERHGPMVLRVCRGVLADPHDTQDAFQATFLVLIRKARGLWVRDSLGPWLHQVAYRTASCARSAAARRRRHERRAAVAVVEPQQRHDETSEDLGRMLHEEIDRLPQRDRALVILCDLEGRTHEQAARHLGLPIGTVKSRLSRSRDRLRERLRRRGLAPEAGMLAAALRPDGPASSLPPALLESTTRVAVQWVAVRSILRGSVATLAQEVLRSMALTGWWKLASVLLVAGATASGVERLAQRGTPGVEARAGGNAQAARDDKMPVAEVKSGKLAGRVVERGSVEASRVETVTCQVEGGSTILRIVREGSRVKKGDLLCELESARPKEQLINQTIARKQAEANYQNARLAREVAEIAVAEYEQGIYPADQKTLRDQIATAQAAVPKAEVRRERIRRARQRWEAAKTAGRLDATLDGIIAELDIDDVLKAAEEAVEREKKSVELARIRLDTLEKYTHAKMLKELKSAVEKARADELAKQAAWESEKVKEVRLRSQIQSCTITAPYDGLVVHYDGPQNPIAEGALVRPRQRILGLIDFSSPMLLNIKVHESLIDLIRPGLRARVVVDAFPGQLLTGVVVQVAPLPDPTAMNRAAVKVYTTLVQLDQAPPSLRPGMTAQATIQVDEQDNVLSVPRQAVLYRGRNAWVAVKKPTGGVAWRGVLPGVGNDTMIEIRQGNLHAGDQVVLNPSALEFGPETEPQPDAATPADAKAKAPR
jgi:RND family efflux transporter MFP subunit